jgi:hypothetical protein
MTTCQRCAHGHPKRCPINWTFEFMIDEPYWDCIYFEDPDEEIIVTRMMFEFTDDHGPSERRLMTKGHQLWGR